MFINITFIISIIVLVLLTVRGYKKGLLGVLFGLIAMIFMVIFTLFAEPLFTDFLDKNTPIRENLTELVIEDLNSRVEEMGNSDEVSGLSLFINSLPDKLSSSIGESAESAQAATIETMAKVLSDRAMRGISSVVTMLVGIIIVLIVRAVIMIVAHLPVVKGLNRLLGTVVGFAEGICVIWVIMFFASVFVSSTLGHAIVNDCSANSILFYLFENNPIVWCLG